MTCPKCGSGNTKRPSVMSDKWKLGTEICDDCGFQDDWIEFIKDLTPERKAEIRRIADPVLEPIRKIIR